jgi:hypothetical protein
VEKQFAAHCIELRFPLKSRREALGDLIAGHIDSGFLLALAETDDDALIEQLRTSMTHSTPTATVK